MKKQIAILTALCMVLCLLAGCGAKTEPPAVTTAPAPAETAAPETEAPAEPVELIVFAAASMTETLTTLGDQYMTDHPEVTIVFSFDSSGTLKTQIQEGADCDIFISAGQKQMSQLDITANPKNLKIVEMDAAQLPRALQDVDMAVINGNYAKEAGLSPAENGLYVEAADSECAQTYANILAVAGQNKDADLTKALVAAITSQAVKDYISTAYSDGSVLCIF